MACCAGALASRSRRGAAIAGPYGASGRVLRSWTASATTAQLVPGRESSSATGPRWSERGARYGKKHQCKPASTRWSTFEKYGFIAKETAALIRKLASLKAAHFELDPSEETRRWYVALSCCVQRANAKVLRGEAVPGRGSSVPSRLLLGGRNDFALCTV